MTDLGAVFTEIKILPCTLSFIDQDFSVLVIFYCRGQFTCAATITSQIRLLLLYTTSPSCCTELGRKVLLDGGGADLVGGPTYLWGFGGAWS